VGRRVCARPVALAVVEVEPFSFASHDLPLIAGASQLAASRPNRGQRVLTNHVGGAKNSYN
jgi:hypothetical protein